MKLIFFCMQINISFLQVDFSFLDIKVFYNVIVLLSIVMIKHSESAQSNKFAMSLQYLKKEVRDGVYFLHTDKVSTSWHYYFWCGPDMSNQNRELVIILNHEKKLSQLVFCSIVMQSIQIFYGGPVMFIVTRNIYFLIFILFGA